MSITVSFTSGSKRENSTKQLTMTATHECNFKNGCSMLNPTLLLELNTTSFPDYTAFKIENRYYRVTEIRSVRNNLFEIDGVVDVLATYKADILASTQYVSYSSHNTSSWLADTRIPVLRNCKVLSKSSLTGVLSSIGCYILSVVGKDSCTTYMVNSEGVLKNILHDIQSWQNNGINAADALIQTWRGTDLDAYTYYADDDSNVELCKGIVQTLQSGYQALTGTLANIQKALADSIVTIGRALVDTGFVGNSYLNAPQAIRSCIWVPFDNALVPNSGSGNIVLGTYDTGVSATIVKSTPHTGSNTVDIPWHYNDWRRGVCEDVYLYLPFVGMIKLSSDSLTNASSITIDWSVTYTDGNIAYKVSAGGQVIGAFGGQCAANYPIGVAQQSSAGEIAQTIMGTGEKMVSSLVNSNISPQSLIAGAVGAKMAEITGTYETANIALSTHLSSVGGIGGGAGIGLGRECICYTVAHDLVVEPANMKNTMGLPTMAPMSLATLTGYCQCANAHVDVAATRTESAAIDSYLDSGFFIE